MARYVAFDLSLRHTGWAVGSIGPGLFTVTDIGVINTDKSWTDFKAGHYLYKGLWRLTRGRTVVMAEIPYGAQSARAAWSLGVSIGIIAALAYNLPSHKKFIGVKPGAVKTALGLRSKRDIINWAVAEHPDLNWYHGKSGAITIDVNNHMADAIGIGLTVYKAGRWT